MPNTEFAIIGGGLAGAATAYHLTRLGARDVVILEQEEVPGLHSSGRNAAILRVVVAGRAIAALAREGGEFIRRTPPDWDEPVELHACGSLLTGARASLERVAADTPPEELEHLQVAWWSPEACVRRVPLLEGAAFETGLWCPLDGVMDVAGLLQGYLRESRKLGARLVTRCEVRAVETRNGRVTGVDTSEGLFETANVVNAAGAWAREIGRMAGAVDAPIVPHRRHLFSTGPMPEVDRDWPLVWDPSREVYFRPESGGLLLSPCDEAPAPPGIPAADPAVLEDLGRKLTSFFPRLSDLSIQHAWAGLRSFTPDHLFVIGWDPLVRGFFWVAGLGGHGVTTSPAYGRLAAQLLSGRDAPDAAPFSPRRFLP